VACDQEIGKIL